MGEQPTEPEPERRKDLLDRVAPVGHGAIRESAGGLFFFAVACIGIGVLMLLVFPFWQTSRKGIPIGVLAVLSIPCGVWFALLGINLLRRTDRSDYRR
ncbi:MAG: hypothetical protein Q7T71_04715 [Herbiconiux sp.]|nr:hypothetical protein [Herbiconiux sp.]